MKPRSFLFVLFIFVGCITTENPSANLINQGNQFARDGLYREAANYYSQALKKDPHHNVAHRNLGMVLVKIGSYKDGAEHLEKSLTIFQNDFDANFYLGESYRAQEKYAEAIYRYQRALKITKDEPRALKSLGWSFFKIRFYSEALDTIKKLYKIDPEDHQAALILARTYLKIKRPKEALEVVQNGLDSSSKENHPYFYSIEGDILFELGKIEQAKNSYQLSLREQPMLAGALLGYGKCLLNNPKTKNKAIEYMERAIRIRPKLVEAYYYLGKATEKFQPQKSAKYFRNFRRLAEKDPEFTELLSLSQSPDFKTDKK